MKGRLKYKRTAYEKRRPSQQAINRIGRIRIDDMGIRLRNRKDSQYNYSIHIRYNDFTFNWLNWMNDYQTVWFVMSKYPSNFTDWVYSIWGIDLDTCSYNDWADFAERSGFVKVRGNPPPSVISQVRNILKIPLEILRKNSNKI